MDVKQRILELMVTRGWTVYRLAKESELSQTTLSNMFRKNNSPTIPTLEAICNAFGISLAEFFTENEGEDEYGELFKNWNSLTLEQKRLLNQLIDSFQQK